MTIQSLRPMDVEKAARVLENSFHRSDAAAAILGAEKAITEKSSKDLQYVLEVISDLRAYGALKIRLQIIAEDCASELLSEMILAINEANELFEQSRQAQGLRRHGLRNSAIARRREARIWFSTAGMAAIERLIQQNQLPSAVREIFSTEGLRGLKNEQKPATELLRVLLTPPARDDDMDRPVTSKNAPVRPGKTARDLGKYGSREKRDSDRQARRMKRVAHSPQGVGGSKSGVGHSKQSKRAANDPNSKKR